jgi:hypothetical protein
MVQYLCFKSSHFSTCQLIKNYIITYKFEWRACTTTSERPPKFLLLCNRVRSYKLIIAYHVYYDYYKIDRNKQSKITVHETDILNSHFTEHFYRQSRLTAVEQITFHDTKIKHFTFHANNWYWPFTAHENTLSHPHWPSHWHWLWWCDHSKPMQPLDRTL